MKDMPLAGRMKAALLIDDGFQDAEAIYPYYRLQEAGHDVVLLGLDGGARCTGKHGYAFTADAAVRKAKAKDFAVVVVPGGNAPDKMRTRTDFVHFIQDARTAGCVIAAICHGPQLLIEAEVVRGRRMTSYAAVRKDLENAGAAWVDEEAVADDGIVTARTPADLPAFMAATLAATRQEVTP